MRSLLLVALALGAGVAQAADLDALKTDTRQKALPVLPKVVGMMKETVAAEGTVAAIPVCKEKAPQLIKALSAETGWDIRRVSLKTRNPQRGTPDVWEARQLADFNIRAANGEIMVRSETYKSKSSAKNCIASIQKRAAEAAVEEAE